MSSAGSCGPSTRAPGSLRWSWDPIPWAGQTTPRTGAGNAWSTLSVDVDRGLVFVPTAYLVLSAGGHGKLGTKLGDYVIGFTYPEALPANL